jgi:hypothetical protein
MGVLEHAHHHGMVGFNCEVRHDPFTFRHPLVGTPIHALLPLGHRAGISRLLDDLAGNTFGHVRSCT